MCCFLRWALVDCWQRRDIRKALRENRSADDFIEMYQRVANTHTKTKYVHLFISGLQASIYSGEVSVANPMWTFELSRVCAIYITNDWWQNIYLLMIYEIIPKSFKSRVYEFTVHTARSLDKDVALANTLLSRLVTFNSAIFASVQVGDASPKIQSSSWDSLVNCWWLINQSAICLKMVDTCNRLQSLQCRQLSNSLHRVSYLKLDSLPTLSENCS